MFIIFDTINHPILLDKLDYYGFDQSAHALCKSYLTNRKQILQYNDTRSTSQILNTGVPQGSILGPLLFLIYINDIKNASKMLFPISYADDTTLYTTLNSIKAKSSAENILMDEVFNNELNNVADWLKLISYP